MPYYITDLVARPNRKTGRVPRGWDLSTHWSILKLDGTKVVLWSADPINLTGVDLIAASPDETVGTTTRSALTSLRGDAKDIPVRFGDALGDLLMNPVSGKWPALRSMNDGVFRLNMGNQLVWSAADPAGPRKSSRRALDSFDRANANIDGATSSDGQFTWTETAGTAWTGVSNQATAGGNTAASALANFSLHTSDMDVQCDVTSIVFGGGSFSSIALEARTAGVFAAGYGAWIEDQATRRVYVFDIADVVEVASVNIGALLGQWRFTANGSSLVVSVNGNTMLSTTDSTTTDINTGGINYQADNAANSVTIDNFLIQDIGFRFPVRNNTAGMLHTIDTQDEGRFNELNIKNWW